MISTAPRAEYNAASVLIGCGRAWVVASLLTALGYAAWALVASVVRGFGPTVQEALIIGVMGLPTLVWGAAAYSSVYMLCIAAPTMLVVARWFGPNALMNGAVGAGLGLVAGLLMPEAPYQIVSAQFLTLAASFYGAVTGFHVTRTIYA